MRSSARTVAGGSSLVLPATGERPRWDRGSLLFVGTATVLLRYGGYTILTDPNFLHAGDHVHLGYGLRSRRLTDPAIPFERRLSSSRQHRAAHYSRSTSAATPSSTRTSREIPRRFPGIDVALLHLGGTRLFGVLLTMDASQGVQAVRIIGARTSIPIHYDDHPVFKPPLSDFERAIGEAGLQDRIVFLRRGRPTRSWCRPHA